MIAFLLALAPLIPGILSIVGVLIKWFGTSEANLKAYNEMVQKNKDSGLTTVDTYEKIDGFHKELSDNPPTNQGDKNEENR